MLKYTDQPKLRATKRDASFVARWTKCCPHAINRYQQGIRFTKLIMARINDVADYIVMKLHSGGVFVNVLKLHKLLYYVQSWNLAFGRGPLFEGRFQAWVHGPVSRDIYDRFVGEKTMYSALSSNDIRGDFSIKDLTDQERAHIDAVLEVYGDFSGDQLEEMTHQEEPWLEARGGLPGHVRSETLIRNETMQSFYAARLNG